MAEMEEVKKSMEFLKKNQEENNKKLQERWIN